MIEITWKWNVKCQDRNWMRMTWGFYWIIPCDSWSGSSSCSLFLSETRLLRRKMRKVWMKEDLLEDQYQRTSEVNRRFWRDTSRHDVWKTMALRVFQYRSAMFAEPRRYFPRSFNKLLGLWKISYRSVSNRGAMQGVHLFTVHKF